MEMALAQKASFMQTECIFTSTTSGIIQHISFRMHVNQRKPSVTWFCIFFYSSAISNKLRGLLSLPNK